MTKCASANDHPAPLLLQYICHKKNRSVIVPTTRNPERDDLEVAVLGAGYSQIAERMARPDHMSNERRAPACLGDLLGMKSYPGI